jgi:hypothetical protein
MLLISGALRQPASQHLARMLVIVRATLGVQMARLFLLVVLLLAACSHGFTDDDIQRLQQDIKEHYEKEQGKELGIGFKVVDVALIRTNDYELTGYAKVEPKAKGQVVPLELQLNCTARMDQQNRSVIWQCKPSGQ